MMARWLCVLVFVFLFAVLPARAKYTSLVEISHAYVLLPAPGQQNTALYMTITNNSDKTLKNVTAASDVARKIELHEMTMTQGVMKMRKVDALNIKPKSVFTLEPGGYHFMVKGLKKGLENNQRIPIKFCIGDSCQQVDVLVKHPLDVEKQTHKSHHAHH